MPLSRVPDGGRDAGLGHGDHQIGGGRRLPRQTPPHLQTALSERAAVEPRVGAREVDELEDVQGRARPGKLDALAAQAVLVDDEDLARLDLTHEAGADDVEGTALAGDDRAAVQVAEGERTHAVRVAKRVEGVRREHGHRERAADPPHRLAHGRIQAVAGGGGDQGGDDLGVAGAAEVRARGAQLRAQLARVHQVAIVPHGDGDAVMGSHQRLRVLPARSPRGRIADVADGGLAAQAGKRRLVEHL